MSLHVINVIISSRSAKKVGMLNEFHNVKVNAIVTMWLFVFTLLKALRSEPCYIISGKYQKNRVQSHLNTFGL